ncbi:MAG TPA: HD domain-containing phosphohydrolase [Longimicrobiales bacterium]
MNETGKLAAYLEAAESAERAGSWDEVLAHCEAAFSRLPVEGDAASAAKLLHRIGEAHQRRGDLELAEEAYAASLAVSGANRFGDLAGAVLRRLAEVERLRGRGDRAEALYVEAYDAARAAGDEHLAATLELSLGALADVRGEREAALGRYGEALERFRRLRDEPGAARALAEMGRIHAASGDADAAESCYNEVFELADRLHDSVMLGCVELDRAMLFLARGDPQNARESCDRAFEVFGHADAGGWLSATYRTYGIVFREMGKPHLADAHFARAIELAEAHRDRLMVAEAEAERGVLHAAELRYREAIEAFNRAHRLLTELAARRELLDIERRLEALEANCLRAAEAWGASIEAADHHAAGHCRRVAEHAGALAEAVGFSGKDLVWIRVGALLHDVGKASIPAAVLNKPGKLSPAEWALVKDHTRRGAELVERLGFPWPVAAMVRGLHEHWDGGGYPDGLRGEEIPLSGRILCIADVYVALTMARSYRPALSREEALRVMAQEAGRVLDPGLFAKFRKLAEKAGAKAEMVEHGRP